MELVCKKRVFWKLQIYALKKLSLTVLDTLCAKKKKNTERYAQRKGKNIRHVQKKVKINFFEACTLFQKSVTNMKYKGVLWLQWDQAKELGDSRCAVRLHSFQVTG